MPIQFQEVTYRYAAGYLASEVVGLDKVCLELREGRFTAVLGAPGSGKSTLLQHFNGLLQPMEGRLALFDCVLSSVKADARQLQRLRKRVGLVLQFPEHQMFEDTVAKDLCFGPMNFGATREDAMAAARNALLQLGLGEHILERNPFSLSGGQLRKTAIASVLASEPDFIVLDEPTASLDQESRKELLQLLSRLCREQGKTIVVVTHRLEELLPYADDVVVLREGAVIHSGELAHSLLHHGALLEEAGLLPPPSIRLLQVIADRLSCPLPSRLPDPAAIAEYIIEALGGGGDADASAKNAAGPLL